MENSIPLTNSLTTSLGRILLVEDEESLRRSLELALSINGYHVITASDGIKGLAWIMASQRSSSRFDLMIMDAMMPGLNGIRLLNRLEQLNAPIPTLAITGCSDTETLVKLRESGVVDILKKPFEPDELLSIVGEIMARRPGAAAHRTGALR